MFWSSDNLFHLVPLRDVDNVGFAAFCVDYSDLTVVSSVGHALVYGRFDDNGDLLARLICP